MNYLVYSNASISIPPISNGGGFPFLLIAKAENT